MTHVTGVTLVMRVRTRVVVVARLHLSDLMRLRGVGCSNHLGLRARVAFKESE